MCNQLRGMSVLKASPGESFRTYRPFCSCHARLQPRSRDAGRQRFCVLATSDYRSAPVTTAGTPNGASNRLQDYLKSPFDVAAFGSRLAVGALLSTQETAQNLQTDLEKLSSLFQDPRPVQDKQQVLAKALEDRLTTFLQRGAAVEAELLTAITDTLPEDVQRQLPPQLKDILLRGSTNKRVPPTPPTPREAQAVPLATVAKNQTAAELDDLRDAVKGLRGALGELRVNAEPSREGMLRVNVLDSRASLSRRLQQLSPAARTVKDVPIQAAVDEANLLLREVDMLRL